MINVACCMAPLPGGVPAATVPPQRAHHWHQKELCLLRRRVCSQHGQALLAFNIYDWMRTPAAQGGAGLRPTVFTYTAAMRAALAGNLIDRALKVVCPLLFAPARRGVCSSAPKVLCLCA